MDKNRFKKAHKRKRIQSCEYFIYSIASECFCYFNAKNIIFCKNRLKVLRNFNGWNREKCSCKEKFLASSETGVDM